MNAAKTAVQAVGAIAVAVLPLLFVGPLGFSEIVNVIIVAIGAFVVWNTKNYPNWHYGKLLASAAATLTTGLVAIASNYSFGDVSVQQWVQLALAVVTTVVVYVVPNSGYSYAEAERGVGPRTV